MAGLTEVVIPAAFASIFFFALLFSLVELVGKVYVSYLVLDRSDLTGEQRLIYLALTWFIPLGWLIYLLLSTERTAELFSEVKFL